MSKKEGYSHEGLFGTVYHYDAKGHKIGESRPGLFGGYSNYDAKGRKIGESRPGLFGSYTNYDAKGHKTGSTSPGLFGSQIHYDAKGHRIGTTDPGFLGGQTHRGNYGNDAGLISSAGGAAGARCDERVAVTAIGFAAAASAAADAQSGRGTRSSSCAAAASSPSYPRDADAARPGHEENPGQAAPGKTVRYIIVRAPSGSEDLYCRTKDRYEIGDWAFAEESGEPVRVLAVVECLEEALPPEVDQRIRVRAK